MPGSLTSSRKDPYPVIRRGSSRRLTGLPTYRVACSDSIVALIRTSMHWWDERRLLRRLCAKGASIGGVGVHFLGGVLHGLDDVLVPSAAAHIAFELMPDVALGGVRVPLEKRHRRHDHARGAIATLQAVFLPETFLYGVVLAILRQTFDGQDVGTVGLNGIERAALDALAIDMDDTGAALARIAADVRAGESELIAQVMNEEEPRLNHGLLLEAVDTKRDRDVLRSLSFGHDERSSFATIERRPPIRAPRRCGATCLPLWISTTRAQVTMAQYTDTDCDCLQRRARQRPSSVGHSLRSWRRILTDDPERLTPGFGLKRARCLGKLGECPFEVRKGRMERAECLPQSGPVPRGEATPYPVDGWRFSRARSGSRDHLAQLFARQGYRRRGVDGLALRLDRANPILPAAHEVVRRSGIAQKR